ncbi:transcriptional regulator [Pseudomonas putida]|nr:transcriptional regulator [Pseudomonas putida]
MLPKEAFATVVRTLRQESRLSQDELTAIDQSHLSRVERGKVNVSLQMFLKIASMLKIEPAVLMLLTASLQAGESAESAMVRVALELKELKRAGVTDSLSDDSSIRSPGRPSHPDTLHRKELALQMQRDGKSLAEIARQLQVSKTTIHRYLSGKLQS